MHVKSPSVMPMNPDHTTIRAHNIRTAQIAAYCTDLAATLDDLAALGFRIDLVMPADAPTLAIMSGHGITLRLEQGCEERGPVATRLRLLCDGVLPCGDEATREIDGIRIEFAQANPTIELPETHQRFVLTRAADKPFHVGRAGLQYRDLIPGRLGGRFIASHIWVPGGTVADYVHYHRVRFQAIYCRSGWARLVYEDQGDPFLFRSGDCVLQPPEIRHRVLEASAGFEAIEIGCPAVHATCADHNLPLPTGRTLPDRLYGSQRFVRHIAGEARWEPWSDARAPAFEARDTGISEATGGLASVRVLRSPGAASTAALRHDGELLFYFVLHGRLDLRSDVLGNHELGETDACVIPANAAFQLATSGGLELLEVALPSRIIANTQGGS